MKDLWNKIKENKTTSIIVAVLVVLLIVFVVLFQTGVLNGNNVALLDGGDDIENSDIVSDLLEELEKLDAEADQIDNSSVSSTSEVINGVAYYKQVKVPLAVEGEVFDYEGTKIEGCESEIVWSNVNVDPTPAPLGAALGILLSSDQSFGKTLADQGNLELEDVVIEARIAKIYLNGDITMEDDCDSALALTQLREVALQFDSVDAVQVFLNGELL